MTNKNKFVIMLLREIILSVFSLNEFKTLKEKFPSVIKNKGAI